MVFDLRGKMGFANNGIMNMLKRLGYLTFDERQKMWFVGRYQMKKEENNSTVKITSCQREK